MSRSKRFWSWHEAHVQAVKQMKPVIGSLLIAKVADENYYLPPLDDALELILRTRVDQQEYIPDVSDCDDFSRKLYARLIANLLVGAFADDAYREVEGKRVRRPPYLFGIAESLEHAFNLVAADDGLFRFVEPQTSELFLPEELGLQLVEFSF